MPILRIKKRENPFVMIDKQPINDERLSWKAKGILVYLLSKPDDWQVWIKDLVKRAHDGKASVRSGIHELIDAGYIQRQQKRQPDNRWGEMEYTVREVPLTGFREAENPSAGNRTHTKNDSTNSETKEICPADVGGKPKSNGQPAAVKVFREMAHRFPAKSWWADVQTIVGEEPDNLAFWGEVVKAYVGLGWSPVNVSGMLDFYRRNELPTTKPKKSNRAPTGKDFISGEYSDSIRR